MKRLLFVFSFVLTLVLLFALPLTSYAADATDAPESVENQSVEPTIFTRVWEYVCENKDTIISFIGDVLMFGAAIAVYIKGKKRGGTIINGVASIATGTQTIGGQQTAVIDAVNRMIDGYNSMLQQYEKYGSLEGKRDQYVIAMVKQSSAILEILHTVYANSRNIPQGVKDLINLKYAGCLKDLYNTEGLQSAIDSLRDVLCDNSVPAQDAEENES